MEQSAKYQSSRHNNDPVVNKDWKKADNDRQAFIDEYKRMQTDDGGHLSDDNYNIRNSPGAKYI